ncbi:MAG TPA: glucarate dehydratase, partial [Cyclobacteriaceae bacterium]|nr:glucarate dehydratase [Cyclobacteriaceae bacterium]
MKIKDLRIHSIAIADPPLRSSYGLHAPYALRTILELESEDGIIGINETYGGEIPAAALRAIRNQLIGADAFRITGLLNPEMKHKHHNGQDRSQTFLVPGENPNDESSRTYAAIEVACLDLIGKSIGVPVCDLIGGRVREKVPFSAYPFYKHAGGGGEGDDLR